MPLFVRDKSFYKSFFSLLIIISLQSLISLGVALVDNIMLGIYDETAMSGAAMANQIQFLLQMIIAGISSGVVVLGAQYWGKNETEPIKNIIGVGMKFAMLAGLIFFAAAYFFPEHTLRLLTNEQAVIDEGVKYIKIMSVTCIVFFHIKYTGDVFAQCGDGVYRDGHGRRDDAFKYCHELLSDFRPFRISRNGYPGRCCGNADVLDR